MASYISNAPNGKKIKGGGMSDRTHLKIMIIW